MTTVAQLIEKLKQLPQDAIVEVLTVNDNGNWITAGLDDINLDTDIDVKDFRNVDPIRFPTIGGKCWVEIGRNDT